MKQTHRSQKLDIFLGEKVKIELVDGFMLEGVLKWNGYRGPVKANTYYVEVCDHGRIHYYTFRKAHVRRIEKL